MSSWHARADMGPQRMLLIEPLAARIASSSASLENLLQGTVRGQHTHNPAHFPDLPSIYTLARTQLEAYLTFHYLFINPASDEEREMKYLIYRHAGLLARQPGRAGIQALYDETQDARMLQLLEQLDEEADSIATIKRVIERHPLFTSTYSSSQRGAILSAKNPRSRTQGWEAIIASSPLATESSQRMWSLYSMHAHSEYLALTQLSEYLMDIDRHDPITRHVTLKNSLAVLSTFIMSFVDFMRLQEPYNRFNPELKAMIEFWHEFAKSA